MELGKRLTKAREARGLSIEEAAHATRLRPAHVRALEEGNLARFPSAAYAKSFLTMYARFLKVDASEMTLKIDTSTQMRVDDFQYLANRLDEDAARQREAAQVGQDFIMSEKSRSWTPLIISAAVALLAALAFVVWSNISRIDPVPVAKSEQISAAQVASPVMKDPEPSAGAAESADPDPEIPRPRVISVPSGTAPAARPIAHSMPEAPEVPAEIPRAVPVSPIATMAANDAETLAELTSVVPRTVAAKKESVPVLPSGDEAEPALTPSNEEEEYSALAADPKTIVLDPHRKTWIVIRTGPGGQPLYEDYLYPTAKPMRLPAGRYFIELKEADAVEISRNGQSITYSAPGVLLE